MAARLGVVAIIGSVAIAGAHAQTLAANEPAPTAQSVKEVERDLSAAREREKRLAAEAAAQIKTIEGLRAQVSAAALAAQDSEDRLSEAEATLTALDEQEEAKTAELEQRRAELARLLAALTRLARNPREALILMPAPPVDTVRTARLLGDVVPPIEAKAKDVAHDIDELRVVRTQVAAQRQTLAAANQRLMKDRDHLQQLIAARAALYEKTSAAHAEAAEQVQSLAHQAANLQDLLHRIEEQRAAAAARDRAQAEQAAQAERATRASLPARIEEGLAEHLRRLIEPKGGRPDGQMVMPVRGRILLGYGDTAEGSPPQRGLTIEARPGAAVVAPFDGKIVFAGPFRGYGRILIIEHGEAYHTLIAGLGSIQVSVGQVVAMGEPIATAGRPDTAGPTDVSAPADIYSKGATGPVLYVELRRHGQPINPLPWLATSDRKVSG